MENREREIGRFGQQLEGGRPLTAILRDTKQDSSEKVVAHLNVQVIFSMLLALPFSALEI